MERAKILISKQEFSIASYFLNQVIEAPTTTSIVNGDLNAEDFDSPTATNEIDMLKFRAKIMLAEISKDDDYSMKYFEQVINFFYKNNPIKIFLCFFLTKILF